MLTKDGPKVLEFNCRFGDPETEVILPLLDSDLYEIMLSCCEGTLNKQQLKWKDNLTAVGVVMASRGYPETSSKGQVITGQLECVYYITNKNLTGFTLGIDTVLSKPNHEVFHCGTALQEKNLVTNGGRVLIAVSIAPQLVSAAANATRACEVIRFDGEQHRNDIAHKGIAR